MKKKETEEQHVLLGAIKNYWPIIFAVSTLVTTVYLYGPRIASLESSVSAKVDRSVVEVQLKNIDDKLINIQRSIDKIVDLHIDN